MSKERAKNRPKRVPIHSRSVLAAEKRPGFMRRWVNDVHGRVEMFEEAGYTSVVGDEDASDKRAQDPSKMGSSVIRKSVGDSLYSVLMEIPEEFYREDQEAKQQRIDELEESVDPTHQHTTASYGVRYEKSSGQSTT